MSLSDVQNTSKKDVIKTFILAPQWTSFQRPRHTSSFTILRKINEVRLQLELPANYCISPSFHVSLLKPVHLDDEPAADVEKPPLPLDIEGT